MNYQDFRAELVIRLTKQFRGRQKPAERMVEMVEQLDTKHGTDNLYWIAEHLCGMKRDCPTSDS
jgi:hypothetical protein